MEISPNGHKEPTLSSGQIESQFDVEWVAPRPSPPPAPTRSFPSISPRRPTFFLPRHRLFPPQTSSRSVPLPCRSVMLTYQHSTLVLWLLDLMRLFDLNAIMRRQSGISTSGGAISFLFATPPSRRP